MSDGGARHVALAILGAFAFANTLLWGRASLRAGAGLPAMLTVRFALTGLLMLGVLSVLGRPRLPARGERTTVFLLGVVAYGLEAVFFFLALQRGTSAAVVLLFYTHVVIVTIGELLLGSLRPSRRIAAAVILSLTGGAIVALAGGDVALSPSGFVFVACSIGCYSGYVLCSARLVRETEPMTAAAWVAFGASIGVAGWGVGRGGFGALPAVALVDIGALAVATAAAFALWFAVVGPLGSSRTAIIMMMEAPFGIVLTSLAFGDRVTTQVGIGGFLVLAGALTAARIQRPETEWLEAATTP